MQAREDMGGIQERFQALSRSMTLSIAPGAGIFISPFSSLDSHLACTACVKMLLKESKATLNQQASFRMTLPIR